MKNLKTADRTKMSNSTQALPRAYQSEGHLEAIPENGPGIIKRAPPSRAQQTPILISSQDPIYNVIADSPYSKQLLKHSIKLQQKYREHPTSGGSVPLEH
jgi:hypothetical protein